MGQLKKIEDRTVWFIAAYTRLDKENRLPSNIELADIMGMPSKSTITNILKRQQNIQPDHWQKFKQHFKIGDEKISSESFEHEPSMREILIGLTEGFRAIAETMRSMESKMARGDTQARMELNLTDVRKDVTTLVERQELAIEEFRERFLEIREGAKGPSKGVHKTRSRNDDND